MMQAHKRARRRVRSAKGDINVTPLIDVLLVLLVIFMVIAPVAPKGLPADVPRLDSAVKQKPEDALVLTLERDGNLRLNREVLDSTTLLPRLTEIFRTRPDRTVFVQADENVLYNEVTGIIDTAVGAGADHVGLMKQTLRKSSLESAISNHHSPTSNPLP